MQQAVVSYPELEPAARRFIDSLRDACDCELKDIIAPHFTLVFPTDIGLSQPDVYAHIQAVSGPVIHARCRRAEAVRNVVENVWHVFLIPDVGCEEIRSLHDRLYSGPLERELRTDIPFLPHITVATLPTEQGCRALADRLNAVGVNVPCRLSTIEIIVCDGGARVVTAARIPLKRC